MGKSYLDIRHEERRRRGCAKRERVRDFAASARLAEMAVSNGRKTDRVRGGRRDEAFEFFDKGDGGGVYGWADAGAGFDRGGENGGEEGETEECEVGIHLKGWMKKSVRLGLFESGGLCATVDILQEVPSPHLLYFSSALHPITISPYLHTRDFPLQYPNPIPFPHLH
jgi:hypothetical protein